MKEICKRFHNTFFVAIAIFWYNTNKYFYEGERKGNEKNSFGFVYSNVCTAISSM